MAAGAAGAIAAKGANSAMSVSAKRSEQTHAAVLDEMKRNGDLKGVADHRAKRLEAQEGVLNWLLRPLFWLNERQKKYYAENFASDMTEKMMRVEDENIVPPDPNIGIQVVEGLSYSLDHPDLKDMYLRLLATASDQKRQDDAHPGFASIIRQISPAEAVHLPDFLNLEHHGAIANVTLTQAGGGQRYLERHVPSIYDAKTGCDIIEPNMASMIDNWTRLWLILTNYEMWSPDGSTYEYMQSRPEYLRWKDQYSDDEDVRVGIQHGIVYPTDFGRQFSRAALP